MPLPAYTTPFIEVPPPTRRALRGGLLDAIGPESVHDLDRLGGHGAGVGYVSDNCRKAAGVFPAPCSPDQPPAITAVSCDITFDASSNAVQTMFAQAITCDCGMHVSYGSPFTLWTSACASPLEDEDIIAGRARDQLTAGAQRGIEAIFATVLPTLADDITPTACHFGIAGAVAALEGQMASCYDGTGVIHAPAFAAPYLAQARQFAPGNGYPLTTWLGTPFALGGGYTGDGPNAEAATDCTFWMYVTPAVDVYRGRVTVPRVSETDHNTTTAIAQQPYAITVDCGGVYGARVNVDPCACP